jgi:hypothetical protein
MAVADDKFNRWPSSQAIVPADYIVSLREQYVTNVINGMIVAVLRRSRLEFTRCYALLSLLELSKDGKIGEYFELEDVFDEARNEGYKGTKVGIRAGLKALYSAGIAVKRDMRYRLHPNFKSDVSRLAIDIKRAISGTV